MAREAEIIKKGEGDGGERGEGNNYSGRCLKVGEIKKRGRGE